MCSALNCAVGLPLALEVLGVHGQCAMAMAMEGAAALTSVKGQRCRRPVGTEISVRSGDSATLKSQVSPKTAEMAKEESKSLFSS